MLAAGGAAAAFGRLCVETTELLATHERPEQPPSGGCVLKQIRLHHMNHILAQPPSGGCVLKPVNKGNFKFMLTQPPSGGCVLKLG